jgi:hypothetical protein
VSCASGAPYKEWDNLSDVLELQLQIPSVRIACHTGYSGPLATHAIEPYDD